MTTEVQSNGNNNALWIAGGIATGAVVAGITGAPLTALGIATGIGVMNGVFGAARGVNQIANVATRINAIAEEGVILARNANAGAVAISNAGVAQINNLGIRVTQLMDEGVGAIQDTKKIVKIWGKFEFLGIFCSGILFSGHYLTKDASVSCNGENFKNFTCSLLTTSGLSLVAMGTGGLIYLAKKGFDQMNESAPTLQRPQQPIRVSRAVLNEGGNIRTQHVIPNPRNQNPPINLPPEPTWNLVPTRAEMLQIAVQLVPDKIKAGACFSIAVCGFVMGGPLGAVAGFAIPMAAMSYFKLWQDETMQREIDRGRM